MTVLNERYKYGLDLFLLSVDEGITGYRDDSLEVKRHIYFLMLVDCKKKSRAIQSTFEDSIIQRALRMDDGRHCETSRTEE